MRDPVTGFEYPKEWQDKCRSKKKLGDVKKGLAVLTSSGVVLRRGFTTGTTAAAACKAAVLSLQSDVSSVQITVPCGLIVEVPVTAKGGRASAKKFSGDYPTDATAGCEFIALAKKKEIGIGLVPGRGIGTFARTTPRFSKGTPAINPLPLTCILQSIQEALDQTGFSGITITLSVPKGTEVAKRTLNSRVGVKGGISILGTTGLVEPWDDHLAESMMDRISKSGNIVLTTGRTGLRYARLRYPDHDIVLVGSKIGDALSVARVPVILFGLPALILKFLKPDILNGTGFLTVEELGASPRFGDMTKAILLSCRKTYPAVHVVIVNRDGEIIGETP
ncbi:MAG: cobalt-precorrin-5B (C(1))-methyltransferase [Methanoregula sp.]|nr:MAG: cobalt-precorrin-5B (C(1))-methyltransferase [Methanoregula sp.]